MSRNVKNVKYAKQLYTMNKGEIFPQAGSCRGSCIMWSIQGESSLLGLTLFWIRSG
jgi:hypothetical protein